MTRLAKALLALLFVALAASTAANAALWSAVVALDPDLVVIPACMNDLNVERALD